jgi:hypothetical protein
VVRHVIDENYCSLWFLKFVFKLCCLTFSGQMRNSTSAISKKCSAANTGCCVFSRQLQFRLFLVDVAHCFCFSQVEDVDKQSKNWLADPANRNCDRPGSW